jgi:hypothetical protein
MSNFIPLSVQDNRQLSTSGKGKTKRYYCDKVEVGKETYLLILANRKSDEKRGCHITHKTAIYSRLAQ